MTDRIASRLEPLLGPAEPKPALCTVGLTKIYPAVSSATRGEVVLFRNLDLEIYPGEMVAIVGESGAGKSSLLHLLAALDRPTSGEIWFGDRRVDLLSQNEAATLRNREIGYVWQFHYLLPEFSAAENVAMPLLAQGLRRPAAIAHARHWLAEVGLAGRAEHRSGELSGGEQQRVSLARALVTQPRILLADEPTGDLDTRTAQAVFTLMQRIHWQNDLTSVLVTHNLEIAGKCDRILRLADGKLESSTAKGSRS